MDAVLAPPDVNQMLQQLVADLRSAAGSNLVGVALYGGLAKGRYTEGISDVNLLIVVHDAGFAALQALAPALTAARRGSRIAPFIATPGDLRAMGRLFPAKVLDMRAAHRTLWGDPSLDGVEVDRGAMRIRVLQEIKNAELRLRQRAVERAAEPDVLWGGLVRSLPKLAVTLEVVLRLRGETVPPDRPGVIRAAGRALGLTDAVAPFAELHRHQRRPGDQQTVALFRDYLALLKQLGDELTLLGTLGNDGGTRP